MTPVTESQLLQWVLAMLGFAGVFVLNMAVRSFNSLKDEVSELNVNFAKMFERADSHDGRLDKHEGEIRDLLQRVLHLEAMINRR
jgi:hypothetical protein